MRKLGPMPDPLLSYVARTTLETLVRLHRDEMLVHNGLTTYELSLAATVRHFRSQILNHEPYEPWRNGTRPQIQILNPKPGRVRDPESKS